MRFDGVPCTRRLAGRCGHRPLREGRWHVCRGGFHIRPDCAAVPDVPSPNIQIVGAASPESLPLRGRWHGGAVTERCAARRAAARSALSTRRCSAANLRCGNTSQALRASSPQGEPSLSNIRPCRAGLRFATAEKGRVAKCNTPKTVIVPHCSARSGDGAGRSLQSGCHGRRYRRQSARRDR